MTTSTRIWNDYLLLYIAVLVGAGALLGLALGQRTRHTGAAQAAGAAVCVAVCLALAVPLWRLEADMRVRAVKWDHQDRWMRARVAAGDRVLPYTPVSVAGMVEPFRRHGRRVWLAPVSPTTTTWSGSPTRCGSPDAGRLRDRDHDGVVAQAPADVAQQIVVQVAYEGLGPVPVQAPSRSASGSASGSKVPLRSR